MSVELCRIDLVQSCSKLIEELRMQLLNLPLIRMCIRWSYLIQDGAQCRREVILHDQLLLIDPFKQLKTKSVDSFALLVHYIVVLENMFAAFEVLRLDGLLRGFDTP